MDTITHESLRALVDNAEYVRVGEKMTVCCLTLNSGFEVLGKSGCLDVSNFDEGLGQKYAYEDAINNLWELEAYRVQHEESKKI